VGFEEIMWVILKWGWRRPFMDVVIEALKVVSKVTADRMDVLSRWIKVVVWRERKGEAITTNRSMDGKQ